MPSIINTLQTPTTPSSFDFVDNPAYYTSDRASSHGASKNTVQDLKESNRRRQWYDPDDEFSVPIHTEHPLITKNPLNMSSFLLNYRAMHRSIEIMTPPPSSTQINEEPAPKSSLHPTIPDGPIYIHHRSTMAGSAISNVVSCPHIHCLQHNRQSHSCSRSGPPNCLKNQLLSPSRFAQQQEDAQDIQSRSPSSHHHHSHSYHGSMASKSQSSSRPFASCNSASSQEHTFLESHIAAIGQWLSLNASSA